MEIMGTDTKCVKITCARCCEGRFLDFLAQTFKTGDQEDAQSCRMGARQIWGKEGEASKKLNILWKKQFFLGIKWFDFF